MKQGQQSTKLPIDYNLDVHGRRSTWDKVYLGYIRDTADGSNMGRIKVYIPELCISDVVPADWIIVDYATPFGGGSPGGGSRSYGFSFLPKIDDQVICAFINGDPQRGIWFGCLIPVGAQVDIPSNPYANGKSVVPDNKVGNTSAVDTTTTTRTEAAGRAGLQTQYNGPAKNSLGNNNLTNGISTPGGHGIVLDDNNGDGYVRLQTRHGTSVLLHDSEDHIIIATGSGLARIEMDRDGNVKIFGQNDINVAANGFLNLTGKKGVNIQSGEKSDKGNSDGPLNIYTTGEAHIYSEADTHLKSNKNMRITTNGEMHRFANGSIYDTAAASGSIFSHANGDVIINSMGKIDSWALDDIHFYATRGSIDILAKKSIRVQSQTADLSVKAQNMLFQSGLDFTLTAAQDIGMTSGEGTYINAVSNILVTTASHMDIKSGDCFRVKSEKDLTLDGGGHTLVHANGNLELKGGRILSNGNIELNSSTTKNIPDPLSAADLTYELPIPGPKIQNTLRGIYSGGILEYPKDAMADIPSVAGYAMKADDPPLTAHTIMSIDATTGGNRVITTVYSVTSGGGTPGADPDQTRVSSYGYSNTGSVMRKTTPPESEFKLGQYKDGQTIPLQVIGFIKGGTNTEFLKYTASGWKSDNTPNYINRTANSDSKNPTPAPSPVDNGNYFTVGPNWPTAKPDSSGLTLMTSDAGVSSIQNNEGSPPPPTPPSMPFPSICDSKKMMIGYGHVITSDAELGEYSGGISNDQKLALLRQDLKSLEKKIMGEISGSQLTHGQWDAIMDFTFLVGFDNFKKWVAPLIKNKEYDAVPPEMVKWVIASCSNDKAVYELQLRQQVNATLFAGTTVEQYTGHGKISGNLVKGTRAKIIYCALMNAFNNPAVAAGFVGNFVQESGLDPANVGDMGAAFGLAQWHSDRRADISRLGNFGALDFSNTDAAVAKNVEYVIWELTKGPEKGRLPRILSARDPVQAADYINQEYERSQAGAAQKNGNPLTSGWMDDIENRRKNAQAVYDRFQQESC